MKIFVKWLMRIIPAFIMLQTLFYKFSGSQESVYIFSKLDVEPWGRILSGVLELFAGITLLVPKTTVYGALLGSFIMTGAIASHLFVLGYEVMGDGGQLFWYAVITFICCVILIFRNFNKLSLFSSQLKK